MPRRAARKLLRFFSSTLEPYFVAAQGAQAEVGLAAEVAFLHVGVADADVAQDLAQLHQVGERPPAGERASGSVTISISGMPARLMSSSE